LAQLLDRVDRPRALAQVSTAVRLNPELEPARHFRATLLEKLGRNEESIADLQAVLRLNPRNFRALDLLGLNYLDLDKPAEAEKALGRAVALAPDEPDVLFHLGRSLMELGRGAEAQQFLDRFQKLRKDRAGTSVPREEPGIIEAASLTPAERSRRIVAQLQQFAREKPGDPSLKMNLGSALLAEGRIEEAAATFRELLALNPGSAISHRAGTTLLRFEQYALARDFLQRAATEMPAARLDLAMALFFTDGPERALKVLEQVPEGQEAGDYLLMKATILDAAGQIAEAERVLERSLDRSISRPRLAQEAALLLVRHNHPAKALELIGRALKAAPDDASIMLTRVVVLGSMGRNNEAEKAVKEIEKRWPEWYRPYLVEGLLMERESRVEGARQRIQIALALGAQEPAARCALARMAAAPPEPRCSCQPGIYEPFFPECRNP
jgi:tetratricopeptide (TPR) repeat protein